MPPKNPTVDLKRKYQRMFEVGIIVSIAFVIMAFKMFPDPSNENLILITPSDVIEVTYVPPTIRQKPPAPPKPPIPIESPIDDDLEDILIDETELDPSENIKRTTITFTEEVDNSPVYDVFDVVEDMPSPIGGIGEIQRKVIYPEIAVRAGVQGKVFVKAIVKQDGNLDSVHVVQGIGAGCDKAAIKAVQNSKFKPGTQRGKPVNVWISIPIKFKLN